MNFVFLLTLVVGSAAVDYTTPLYQACVVSKDVTNTYGGTACLVFERPNTAVQNTIQTTATGYTWSSSFRLSIRHNFNKKPGNLTLTMFQGAPITTPSGVQVPPYPLAGAPTAPDATIVFPLGTSVPGAGIAVTTAATASIAYTYGVIQVNPSATQSATVTGAAVGVGLATACTAAVPCTPGGNVVTVVAGTPYSMVQTPTQMFSDTQTPTHNSKTMYSYEYHNNFPFAFSPSPMHFTIPNLPTDTPLTIGLGLQDWTMVTSANGYTITPAVGGVTLAAVAGVAGITAVAPTVPPTQPTVFFTFDFGAIAADIFNGQPEYTPVRNNDDSMAYRVPQTYIESFTPFGHNVLVRARPSMTPNMNYIVVAVGPSVNPLIKEGQAVLIPELNCATQLLKLNDPASYTDDLISTSQYCWVVDTSVYGIVSESNYGANRGLPGTTQIKLSNPTTWNTWTPYFTDNYINNPAAGTRYL